jgi:hypothetical protein
MCWYLKINQSYFARSIQKVNVFCPVGPGLSIDLFDMKHHPNYRGDIIHPRIGIQSKIGKEQTDPRHKSIILNLAF